MAAGSRVILVALLVVPPLLSAILAPLRATLWLGAISIAVTPLSGVWNDWLATTQWAVSSAGAVVGTALVLVAASVVTRPRREGDRLRLLAEVGAISDGTHPLPGTLERLGRIVVPAFADGWLVDGIGPEGEPRRLTALVHGASPEVEAAIARRRPVAAAMSALREGAPHLLLPVDAALVDALAASDGDAEAMRAAGARDALVLPLRARGNLLGALGLVQGPSGRSFSPDDVAFASALAGRIALALDNAGLSRELTGAERRLDAVLVNLDEAVTVQDPTGRIVYANDAAVELLRVPEPGSVIGRGPGEVVARYEVEDEAGRPLGAEDFPGSRLLRGEEAEPMVVRNRVRETGEERWLFTRATAVRDDDGELSFVANVIEDVSAEHRARRAQRMLAEAGRLLAGSQDPEEALRGLARIVVPDLAEWCGVDVPGARGVVRNVAAAHVDPAKAALARELRERWPVGLDEPAGLASVLRGEGGVLVPEVSAGDLEAYARDPEHLRLLRAVGFGSLLLVPMPGLGGAVVGALTLASSRPRRFGEDERALAEELARRAGAVVHSARLSAERAAIAHTLQASLLPGALPAIPGWRAAVTYRPVGEVVEAGGDFYDAFGAGGGWAVVVGDVAGKGARAAALTALARHTLRTAARVSGGDVAIATRELNAALLGEEPLALCTAASAALGDGVARLVCAGHPLPVAVRDGRGSFVGRTGPLLGAWDDAAWPAEEVALGPGDLLVLYTDGVLDVVGEGGEHFGEERLRAALDGTPAGDPEAALARLDAALAAFSCKEPEDDVAVLALAWTGVRTPIPGNEHGPARARTVVRERLAAVLPADRLDAVLLMTSELVTNAIRHGGASVERPAVLGLDVRDGRVRVEVEDPGPGFAPAPRTPGADGGFGLGLVDRAAARWGVERDGGSRVWFEVPTG